MEKPTFDQLPEAFCQFSNTLEENNRLLRQLLNQTNEPISDKPLTAIEAAKFLDLALPTIYSKVSRNEMPSIKRGKRLYFFKDQLVEYLKNGLRQTADQEKENAAMYLKKRKRG